MYDNCKFCGSANIRETEFTFAGDDGEEDVDMIECLDCDASARKELWNNCFTIPVDAQNQLVSVRSLQREANLATSRVIEKIAGESKCLET